MTPVGRSGSQNIPPEASHPGAAGPAQLGSGRRQSLGAGLSAPALQTSPVHLVWCPSVQGNLGGTWWTQGTVTVVCVHVGYGGHVAILWLLPPTLWGGWQREERQKGVGPYHEDGACQNRASSAGQTCVRDSEFLILIDSSFRAHSPTPTPGPEGVSGSPQPSASLTGPGAWNPR